MYILASNKRVLIEFGRIEIKKTRKKFALNAWARASVPNPVIIAMYDTEERAIEELKKIEKALLELKPVYEVE